MFGHGPSPAHSQAAHTVRDTNHLFPTDQHCTIMEALQTQHLSEGLIVPLTLCCCSSPFLSVAYWQLQLNHDLFLPSGRSWHHLNYAPNYLPTAGFQQTVSNLKGGHAKVCYPDVVLFI